MAGFEHLLKSFDVGDLLDEIASAEPPAYLRRCFAEAISTPTLSFPRVQQLAVCAMVLDSIVNDRPYDALEAELIADWREHHAAACRALQPTARTALARAAEIERSRDPPSAAELDELLRRLGPAA